MLDAGTALVVLYGKHNLLPRLNLLPAHLGTQHTVGKVPSSTYPPGPATYYPPLRALTTDFILGILSKRGPTVLFALIAQCIRPVCTCIALSRVLLHLLHALHVTQSAGIPVQASHAACAL